MNRARNYAFRKLKNDDFPLLNTWQAHPHVRQWWDRQEPYTDEEMADPRVARWIVSYDARPFAFMQDYCVHGWDSHHFAGLPKGSRGIDQYIGEPDLLGQGHGTAFISARLTYLFENGAPVIGVDPHPDNTRAIAVYRKLGFEPSGPPAETAWGRILPMLAKR